MVEATTSRSRGARPTDDELLDVSAAEFARAGLHGVTMDMIAERANCTKPTLYAHFGSKQDLYTATVQREAARTADVLLAAYEAASAQPPAQQLRTNVTVFFDLVATRPAIIPLLFDTGVDDVASKLRRQLMTRLNTRLAEDIRTWHADNGRQITNQADVLAAMMTGACAQAATQAIGLDLDLDATCEFVIKVIANALMAEMLPPLTKRSAPAP